MARYTPQSPRVPLPAIRLPADMPPYIWGDILDQMDRALNGEAYIEPVPAKSGIAGSIGFEITVKNKNNQEQIRQALNQIDGVRFAIRG